MAPVHENEGKCCDAVLRVLERRTGEVRHDLHVDPRGSAGAARVDVCVQLGADRYVLEHTRIDPFEEAVKIGIKFSEFVKPIEKRLYGVLPGPAYHMHHMPYADDRFDVVLLGWVLGYSNDLARVAREVLRVARPGALVAIGHENDPNSKDELDAERGFALDGTGFESTDEMLALFAPHVDAVLFRHDVHPSLRHVVSHVMVLFHLVM